MLYIEAVPWQFVSWRRGAAGLAWVGGAQHGAIQWKNSCPLYRSLSEVMELHSVHWEDTMWLGKN
jgi:hypothetical protein